MLQMLARSWWVLVLRGVCGIIFGVMAFAWPGVTDSVIVLLYGAYALVDGIFALVALMAGRRAGAPMGLLLFEGIVGIGAGLAAFAYPGITLLVLVYLMAAWSIMTGAAEIAAAIRLRKEVANEWFLALAGLVSILFGVVVAARPAAGALALAWMVGFYAILFGTLLVVLGLRLKSHAPAAQGSVA